MLKLLLGIAVLIALLGAAITRDKMLAREANGATRKRTHEIPDQRQSCVARE
jgi:hypothetical protein